MPHVEPGQGWHRRSKATLSLQTFTSSAPMCFTARSQAPAYYRQKGEVSPDPTLRLFVGPPGNTTKGHRWYFAGVDAAGQSWGELSPCKHPP